MKQFSIIQGGMGVGVSDWRLARAVSVSGELGVVSGTALDILLVRRLEQGDTDGAMRRALSAFPDQAVAASILERYYKPEGIGPEGKFTNLPLWRAEGENRELEILNVAANFAEIYLAKEGHEGLVGINYLDKISLPNPSGIYGAMLAGVDYVLMGAGIPLHVPGILDRYAQGLGCEMKVTVEGAAKDERHEVSFEPSRVLANPPSELKRPKFLAIVSSNVLAMTMVARASGKVDGIVVENHTAGGHNAPPRGGLTLSESGEPEYGPKDEVDYGKLAGLKVPFWIGGSRGTPEGVGEAVRQGAFGVQVGTLFAFCRESGLLPDLKRRFLEAVKAGTAKVFTHPLASPTGYPFKLGELAGTLSGKIEHMARKRVCNIGLLREIFKKEDGSLGYRCPAEDGKAFAAKGGDGQKNGEARCLCNGLLANLGLGMGYSDGTVEKPLLTVGTHLESLRLLIQKFGLDYSAQDVLRFLGVSGAR